MFIFDLKSHGQFLVAPFAADKSIHCLGRHHCSLGTSFPTSPRAPTPTPHPLTEGSVQTPSGKRPTEASHTHTVRVHSTISHRKSTTPGWSEHRSNMCDTPCGKRHSGVWAHACSEVCTSALQHAGHTCHHPVTGRLPCSHPELFYLSRVLYKNKITLISYNFIGITTNILNIIHLNIFFNLKVHFGLLPTGNKCIKENK